MVFDQILGLNLSEPQSIVIPEEVIEIAEHRMLVRENKDWAESDNLRDKIFELGFIVEDTRGGYRLEKL